MELQKMGLPEKELLLKLLVAIQSDGSYNIQAINKAEISHQVKKFKTDSGGVNYPALFKIPVAERIFELAKKDFVGTIQIISVAVLLAIESINLKRPMTTGQVVDLAEAIIDDSEHDKISVEDILLFLQKLTRGEYGEMYDSMDVPKFMKWFGVYRDERWDAGVKIRDEKIEALKNLGDDNHFERTNRKSPIGEELAKYTENLERKKDEIELLKRENRNLRDQKEF